MTAFTLSVVNERWLDEVVLQGGGTLAAGEINDTYALPSDLGDVALMEATYTCNTIATVVANPELLALQATITNAGGSTVDIVGVERFTRINSSTAIAAYLSPDPLVLWRRTELLRIFHPDVDSNGAPTVVGSLSVKVVRVRPLEVAAGQGPIQLVR